MRWEIIAVLFFFIAASMGLTMRLFPFFDIPIAYNHLLQAHSHIAFLGWAYLAIALLFTRQMLPQHCWETKQYQRNFAWTTLWVIGMGITFPIMGYKSFSIAFLTLFLITSCIWAYRFWKDYRNNIAGPHSKNLVLSTLFFYILSGMAPLALGPIAVLHGKGNLYYLAVYYYLHFLYNGFFALGLFTLLYDYLERHHITFSSQKAKRFFLLTVGACIPAYALSTLWAKPPTLVYIIAALAGISQLVGGYFLLTDKGVYQGIAKQFSSKWSKRLYLIALVAYGIKLLTQALSAVPLLAEKVYYAKSFMIIGYLHLVFIGVISTFLLSWFFLHGLLNDTSQRNHWAIRLFILAVIFTEVTLFAGGILQWNNVGWTSFSQVIIGATLFFPLSIGVLLIDKK